MQNDCLRTTPVLLPGKSHGWRSLVGCSPWGRKESDTTERLHFDFSLSCIGEGNGNPLTPVFLPGESQGRGSLVGCCLWGRTELDTTEVMQNSAVQESADKPILWRPCQSIAQSAEHALPVHVLECFHEPRFYAFRY